MSGKSLFHIILLAILFAAGKPSEEQVSGKILQVIINKHTEFLLNFKLFVVPLQALNKS